MQRVLPKRWWSHKMEGSWVPEIWLEGSPLVWENMNWFCLSKKETLLVLSLCDLEACLLQQPFLFALANIGLLAIRKVTYWLPLLSLFILGLLTLVLVIRDSCRLCPYSPLPFSWTKGAIHRGHRVGRAVWMTCQTPVGSCFSYNLGCLRKLAPGCCVKATGANPALTLGWTPQNLPQGFGNNRLTRLLHKAPCK